MKWRSFNPKLIIVFSLHFLAYSCLTNDIEDNAYTHLNNTTSPNQFELPLSSTEQPILKIDSQGHMDTITSIMFADNDQKLISVSKDKTIRIWDIETGYSKLISGQIDNDKDGMLYAAALSPDHRYIAITGYPTKYGIRIIDLSQKQVVQVLSGHSNIVNSLSFSNDGKRLLSGSADNTAIIWDVITGNDMLTLGEKSETRHQDSIVDVDFSPCGKIVATASLDKTIHLWNSYTGECLSILKGHQAPVNTITFSPNGRYLISGSQDKTIRLWNMKSGLVKAFFKNIGLIKEPKLGQFIKVLAMQDCSVEDLSISPDSRYLLTGCASCEKRNTNYIYSVPDGSSVVRFTQHKNIVLATAISSDSQLAATAGGEDNEIYIWKLKTGEIKHNLSGKGKQIWGVGFHKNGRSIAWGNIYRSKNIFVHGPLEHNFNLLEYKANGKIIPSLTLGKKLVSHTHYLAGIHTTTNYTQGLKKNKNISLETEADEISGEFIIRKNGRVKHRIRRYSSGNNLHNCLTLTPNGKIAISGGMAGYLTAYSTRTGKILREFSGHTGDIWGVAVSPDNKWLVSGSSDQTVRLWRISSGKNLLTIFSDSDKEWVAWTPEGYYWSSLYGDRYIGWHVNMGIRKTALYFSAAKFSDFRNRKIVENYILENNNFVKKSISIIDRLPPEIFIEKPNTKKIVTQNPKFCIQAYAQSRTSHPIEDIQVLLNGRINNGLKRDKTIRDQYARVLQCFDLTEKKNSISVLAKTALNESDPETINVILKDTVSNKKPDIYLLSIGISDYLNPDFNLQVAHKDAQAIANIFENQKGKQYQNVHTRLLENNHASKENILNGLQWISKGPQQEDICLIFIAGHGKKDDYNDYYFLPYEYNGNLFTEGINSDMFKKAVQNIPSKVLIWIDTCYSGSVAQNLRDALTDSMRELTYEEKGIVLMMASSDEEQSLSYAPLGHGIFTKALIEGIGEFKADKNQDESINIKELDDYLKQRVNTISKGAQHATTVIPIGTVGNFDICTK
jgi:WD40 repeat protein